MDLLTTVGQVTKRRGEYFSRAKNLALKVKKLDKLEDTMNKRAKALVSALKDREVKFDEYSRSLIDETLTSALAAVFLGAGKSAPEQKMERAWPIITGQILPPLVEFLNQTEKSLEQGVLLLGDESVNFDEPFDYLETQKMSWLGVINRVVRYIVNPGYSFFNLGDYFVRQDQGYKEMRRVPIPDGRTCPDCIRFGNMGWQPLGSLPMPGQECRCFDYCRCHIEYR